MSSGSDSDDGPPPLVDQPDVPSFEAPVKNAELSPRDAKLAPAVLDLIRNLTGEGTEHSSFTIWHAAYSDIEGVATLLLLSGADPNQPRPYQRRSRQLMHQIGYTPIHYAAAADHVDMMHLLSLYGGEYTLKASSDQSGALLSDYPATPLDAPPLSSLQQTPLMAAVGNDCESTTRYLIHAGVSLSDRDSRGLTVLAYALHSVRAFAGLAARGADIATVDDAGRSLLHLAALWGHEPMVRVLALDTALPLDALDDSGSSPLALAAAAGHTAVCRALLLAGATPCAPSSYMSGHTRALIAAAHAHGQLQPLRAARGDGGPPAGASAGASAAAEAAADDRATIADAVLPSHMSDEWHIRSHVLRSAPQLGSFVFYATAPNVAVYAISQIPSWPMVAVGMLAFFGYLMSAVSRTAMQHRVSLVTTGWYLGGITCGIATLAVSVATTGSGALPSGWAVAFASCAALMVAAFLSTMFSDSGWIPVHGSAAAAERRELYALLLRGAFDTSEWCTTCLVRKRVRSKHCTTTYRCVARFDHYCVWLGNAIGLCNHRTFAAFCVLQFIGQTIFYKGLLAHYEILYDWAVASDPGLVDVACSMRDVILAPPNRHLFINGVVYSAFAYLFITAMIYSNAPLILRNVLANEGWFAQRYPSTCYYVADQPHTIFNRGAFGNLAELLSKGSAGGAAAIDFRNLTTVPEPQPAAVAAAIAWLQSDPPPPVVLRNIATFPPAVTRAVEADPAGRAALVRAVSRVAALRSQLEESGVAPDSLAPRPPADAAAASAVPSFVPAALAGDALQASMRSAFSSVAALATRQPGGVSTV